MEVRELVAAMEEIAPTRYAESWDNVGLLVGDGGQQVSGVLLTIDYTEAVASEARKQRCNAVIAYHPPIFSPLKRVVGPGLIFEAVRDGLAIYSPHTALDIADGGTNDMLADVLGMVERAPLRVTPPQATQYKLITFVPEEALEQVSEALFAAGAGRIGDYSRCSFRSPGTGTFFGEEGANPAVGQAGKLEHAPEVRVETIVPIAKIVEIVQALRRAHPYEEPAFDLLQLAAPPEARGQGRIGTLPAGTMRAALIERIKRELGVDHLLIAGPTEGVASRAACCAGACGDMLNDALAQKADVYLTGEMRHHDALRAACAGMMVICALHSNSERAVLRRVKEQLERRFASMPVVISQQDRDPFAVR